MSAFKTLTRATTAIIPASLLLGVNISVDTNPNSDFVAPIEFSIGSPAQARQNNVGFNLGKKCLTDAAKAEDCIETRGGNTNNGSNRSGAWSQVAPEGRIGQQDELTTAVYNKAQIVDPSIVAISAINGIWYETTDGVIFHATRTQYEGDWRITRIDESNTRHAILLENAKQVICNFDQYGNPSAPVVAPPPPQIEEVPQVQTRTHVIPVPVPVTTPEVRGPVNGGGYLGAGLGYGDPNIKGGGLTISAGGEGEIGVTDFLNLYASGILIDNEKDGFEGQFLVGPQLNIGDSAYVRAGAGRAIAGSGTQFARDPNGDELAMSHAADINGYIADWAAFATVGIKPTDNSDISASYRQSISDGDNKFTEITGGASFENTDDGENGLFGYFGAGLTNIKRLQGIPSGERNVLSVRGEIGDTDLITDTLGASFGAQFTQSETTITPVPSFALDSTTKTFGPNASLLLTPTDNLDLKLTASYMFQTENNGVNNVSNFSNKEQGAGLSLGGVYRWGGDARNASVEPTEMTYRDCIMERSENSFDQNPDNDDPAQCDHLSSDTSSGARVRVAADGTRSLGSPASTENAPLGARQSIMQAQSALDSNDPYLVMQAAQVDGIQTFTPPASDFASNFNLADLSDSQPVATPASAFAEAIGASVARVMPNADASQVWAVFRKTDPSGASMCEADFNRNAVVTDLCTAGAAQKYALSFTAPVLANR